MKPKVSIVIPVYNGGDYLKEAIDSALAQTYENLEVVVVNDGSSDEGKTERIALSYGDKIRYFSKPNGGVASALNKAIAEMSGEYFSWLSHDDLYTPDKVEKEMQKLESLGRDDVVIYSDYSVFTSDPEKSIPVRLKGVPPAQFRYWITVENCLHGCTLLIPRAAFERAGGFNEALRTTQDYDLWFRMAKDFSFVHIPAQLVKARSHAEQGSHKMSGIVLRECNELLSNFILGLDTKEIVEATGRSLAESYAIIGASMHKRKFNEAAMLADKLAAQASGNNMVSRMTAKKKSIKSQVADLGRKILPTKVKRAIKAAIRPAASTGVSAASPAPGVSEAVKVAPLKEKFSEVYEHNLFAGSVSRSGEGSDMVQTEIIRRELPRVVKDYSIKTFMDAPCGDWFWMRKTDLGVEQYIGVDIVDAMIAKHQKEFGSASKQFYCLNLAEDALPKADLIFCRDCLVHLNFEDGKKIIANFKRSGAKYLLTTTFVDRTVNNDLVGKNDFWRTLNMRLAPFNFPEPLLLINEGCTEDNNNYMDKCLGLWKLEDINI